MSKAVVFLCGILCFIFSFILHGIMFSPLFDILHGLLNVSTPPVPPLDFYFFRTLAAFQSPLFMVIILIVGGLLAFSREYFKSSVKGALIYFALPCILSALRFLIIIYVDYKGIQTIFQAFIRSLDFLSPFIISWFLYNYFYKIYLYLEEKT